MMVPTIPYVGYLQIGAYEKRSNAERLADSVRGALGVHTHIREVMRYSHPLYRIQVGPLVRTEVADVIIALEGHGIMRHFLITK
jgi:cell division septation protein DedD